MGFAVVIDNDIYNRLGSTWWEDDNPLAFLRGMTPGRLEYFRRVLTQLGRMPTGGTRLAVLDIGSGGGFLAEEFCRLGFDVTGVDPSEVSVTTARRHAVENELDIRYLAGGAELLPVNDGSFDVAYCSDVLEHVDDVDRALAETARALKPSGIYLFDTLNRTFFSKVLTKAVQQWRPTRVIDFALHDWTRFIRPTELAERMRRHGLLAQGTVGLGPRARPWAAAADALRLRRGRLSYRQLGERLDFGAVRFTGVSYMGYAVKIDLSP